MGHETEHQADGAAFLRPPASAFDARWKHLGTILMEQGLLDPDQLRAAFAEQIETGRRLGDIALERGWLTEEQLASALAEQYGMQFCDLREHRVDPEVALLLREQVVRANHALPIQYLEDGSLLVGVVDPSNLSLLDNVKIALDQNVTFCVVLGDDFEAEVRRLFRADVEIDEQDEPDYEPDTVEREEVMEASATIPAVRLVNSALGNGIGNEDFGNHGRVSGVVEKWSNGVMEYWEEKFRA